MPATPQEIFQRYVIAGAMHRDADAVAELFTADGVYEAPLVPEGHILPRRLEGHEEIRKGLAAYYERLKQSADTGRTVDMDRSRHALHTTADPEVFIAEIDTAFDGPTGPTTMSLVQIFRLHDGKIAMLRDYFAPDQAV